MKYQVLGHKRRLQKGDKPYEIVAEFDDLVQLYFMMDKVNSSLYNSILVIDTYTNEAIAGRELEEPYTKRRKR